MRAELHIALARFFERYDLLLTPTMPLRAFDVGHVVPPSGDSGEAWTDWSPFSYPFNLTQQPAASIPCGLTRTGLPIGLQIVGAIGADALVLRASRALEEARSISALSESRTRRIQPPKWLSSQSVCNCQPPLCHSKHSPVSSNPQRRP